jgi:hypothetical protein
MASSFSAYGRVERDPALLAFIKCHLTSFTRWNALRMLAERPGCWVDPRDVARAIHKPLDAVCAVLEDLARERLVQCQDGPTGPTYCLDPTEPTSRVVGRLIDEARRHQELRQIIVSRLVTNGAIVAPPALQPTG